MCNVITKGVGKTKTVNITMSCELYQNISRAVPTGLSQLFACDSFQFISYQVQVHYFLSNV